MNFNDILINYLPSITAIFTVIMSVVKLTKDNKFNSMAVKLDVKELKESYNIAQSELHAEIICLMKENAELKKKLNKLLEQKTGIKED